MYQNIQSLLAKKDKVDMILKGTLPDILVVTEHGLKSKVMNSEIGSLSLIIY